MAKKKSTTKQKGPAPKKGKLTEIANIVDKVLPRKEWAVDLDAAALKKPLPHFSTGSFVLDYQIGGQPNQYGIAPCPGIPRGRIVQVYGHESSGKTTMALTAAASVCQMGGQCIYIDWENEIVPSYAKALGVPIEDPDRFLLAQPNTLEDGMKIMWAAASRGVHLIVIDSVGAGVPKAIFEQSLEEQGEIGRVGLIAAKWSSYIPKLKQRIGTTGTAIIAIGQCRQKIATGPMARAGGKNVQGGDVWKYYSCVRMSLQRIRSEKGRIRNRLTHKVEERIIGGTMRSQLDKCKVSSSQGSQMEFYLRWGTGIDDVRTIMEIAKAYKIIVKSGSWLQWDVDGESIRAQGADSFKKMLIEKGKYEKLRSIVVKAIEDSDDSSQVEKDDEVDELLEIT
jgi:recombination protein RecA